MTYARLFSIAVITLFQAFFGLSISAQIERSNTIPVTRSGNNLPNAWCGGLNAPQFSAIDLNMDGIEDLFVFDREGDRIMTFINNGSPGQVDYVYAPAYEKMFPELYAWALLADYNNDGKADIFTYNQGGIRVFKNTSGTSLSFQLEVDPYLKCHYNAQTQANIYTSSQDIPAIVDVDGDGDLDVLTFGGPSAQSVYYVQNFAADSGSLETFRLHLNTYCWGKFEEDQITNKVSLGKNCPKSGGGQHAGSTICAFNSDSDPALELLLGDISFTNMVFLDNGGTITTANMISQDTAFPFNDVPIDLHSFPAAYHLDVDNDGLKDLLICPNFLYSIEDKHGVQFYKNVGSAGNYIFQLKEIGFLQKEMFEFGSGAFPVFFDYNFNGLSDLVIGNQGSRNGYNIATSGLQLYHNTGSINSPSFELANENFGGLDTIALNTVLNIPTSGVIPTFEDLDNDGYRDMIVGDMNGKIHLFKNKPFSNYSHFELETPNFQNIDVGQHAAPQLIDLNKDGLFDLVIGEQDGNLNYYKNTGTKSIPVFTLVTETLGNVDTRNFWDIYGYSQPHFFRRAGEYHLICGAENGMLYYYQDIDQNLSGSFTLVDSSFLDIDVGRRSCVAMSDLDLDGMYDLVIGNYGGGISHYKTSLQVGIASRNFAGSPFDFDLLPINKDQIQIRLKDVITGKDEAQVQVLTSLGQPIKESRFGQFTTIDLSNFASGMYLISVRYGTTQKTKKYILNH